MSQACNFNSWAPIHSPSLSVTLIICLHFLSNIPERTIGHYTSWENSFCFLKDRSKLNNDVDKHTCPSVAYTTDLQNCWQIWVMCVLSNKSRFPLYSDVCPWFHCTNLFFLCCSSCQQTYIKFHTYCTYYLSCTSTDHSPSPKGQVTEHIHKPTAMMLQTALTVLCSSHAA